jgi:hypothetical protein
MRACSAFLEGECDGTFPTVLKRHECYHVLECLGETHEWCDREYPDEASSTACLHPGSYCREVESREDKGRILRHMIERGGRDDR